MVVATLPAHIEKSFDMFMDFLNVLNSLSVAAKG